MNRSEITTRQFCLLVTLFTIGSSILFVPSQLAEEAQQDSWLALGIGIIINLLVVGLYLRLASFYPDKTLYDLMENLMGKWAGRLAIALTFLFAYFVCVISLVYYVGFFFGTQIFPDTPIFYLNGLFVIATVYALRLGLATIARASEIYILVFIFLFVLLIAALIPEVDANQFKPALTTPLSSLLRGAISYNSFSTFPLFFFLTIYPIHVKNRRKAARNFIWGTLWGGLVLWLICTVAISVLGAKAAATYTFPGYVLAQRVNIGDFFTRIEASIPTIWMISLFIKLLIYFYASLQALGKLTGVRQTSIYIIPLALVAWVLSVDLFTNSAHLMEWSRHTLPVITFMFGVPLPFLLLVLALVRRRFQRGGDNEEA